MEGIEAIVKGYILALEAQSNVTPGIENPNLVASPTAVVAPAVNVGLGDAVPGSGFSPPCENQPDGPGNMALSSMPSSSTVLQAVAGSFFGRNQGSTQDVASEGRHEAPSGQHTIEAIIKGYRIGLEAPSTLAPGIENPNLVAPPTEVAAPEVNAGLGYAVPGSGGPPPRGNQLDGTRNLALSSMPSSFTVLQAVAGSFLGGNQDSTQDVGSERRHEAPSGQHTIEAIIKGYRIGAEAPSIVAPGIGNPNLVTPPTAVAAPAVNIGLGDAVPGSGGQSPCENQPDRISNMALSSMPSSSTILQAFVDSFLGGNQGSTQDVGSERRHEAQSGQFTLEAIVEGYRIGMDALSSVPPGIENPNLVGPRTAVVAPAVNVGLGDAVPGEKIGGPPPCENKPDGIVNMALSSMPTSSTVLEAFADSFLGGNQDSTRDVGSERRHEAPSGQHTIETIIKGYRIGAEAPSIVTPGIGNPNLVAPPTAVAAPAVNVGFGDAVPGERSGDPPPCENKPDGTINKAMSSMPTSSTVLQAVAGSFLDRNQGSTQDVGSEKRHEVPSGQQTTEAIIKGYILGLEAPSNVAPEIENSNLVASPTAVAAPAVNVGLGNPVPGEKSGGPENKPDGTANMLSSMPSSSTVLPAFAGRFLGRNHGSTQDVGSKRKRECRDEVEYLGEVVSLCGGRNFTPHIMIFKAGVDLKQQIISFTRLGPQSVCIISATGDVSSVTINQPDSPWGTLTYEGRYEILKLTGSFIPNESGGVRSVSCRLSIFLGCPDGNVVGGEVVGPLICATPVQDKRDLTYYWSKLIFK